MIISSTKKRILAALAAALFGLAGGLFLTRQKPQPLSAPITLPDRTSLRVLAVTYGTNHVFGTRTARMAARLPSALQDVLVDILGQRAAPAQVVTTPTPELVLWLDHRTNSAGAATPISAYFTALLSDGSNFISGQEDSLLSFLPWGSRVESLHFSVFPRRDPQMTLNIFYHDTNGGVRICNNLSFANPLYRGFPQWQAEPLPATRRVGDVEVTLLGLETGHDGNSSAGPGRDGRMVVTYGTNRLDGQNHTAVELKLRPVANTNELWQVIGVEFSDATGNRGHNTGMSWAGSDNGSFSFMPGLWPNEAAWKLKLEINRSQGFRPEELFTFQRVPLGALDRTNTIAWTTNVAGVAVTLQYVHRRAPLTNEAWSSTQLSEVHFTVTTPPTGTQVDLLRMVCDTGKTNHSDASSSSANQRDYCFRDIPLAAQTADFTFAIQQSRTVEFVVKPQLPEVKAAAAASR